MTTTTLDTKVEDLLAQKRIAIAGGCPMMYGDGVGHTCMRWILRLTGSPPT
jgi:hypothetical protein